MALSSIVKQSHDGGSIIFADGTGTPLTTTVRFDQADFSASGLKPGQRDAVVYQTRGTLRSVRNGARVFPSISFSLMLTDFSETSTGTLLDFIYATSGTPYASRVSTNTALSERFLCKITWNVEGTSYGDSADHQLIFNDCDITEISVSEGEPTTVNISATVYGDLGGDLADDVD